MLTSTPHKPAVLAGNLLFAAASLSIISFLMFRPLPTSVLSWVGWVTAFGFYLLIAYVVRRGDNGARTVLLMVVGAAVFNHLVDNGFTLPQLPSPPLRAAAWVLETLLLSGALALLYLRPRSELPVPSG
ncbi:hypothetical protein [Hymenobacter psychrophilus]|uniref:Uncharacterized protein n=1 Tax=Hymenobacter psychrophilus TaxID=651662 RepID=A0A1H3EZC0_9BACT|nr:hypothetical protein [Hymenobacter psychrophilus]SDX83398.1 hypothetical protein SAMN04488069_103345 [Hymenobacter psychrophilus]